MQESSLYERVERVHYRNIAEVWTSRRIDRPLFSQDYYLGELPACGVVIRPKAIIGVTGDYAPRAEVVHRCIEVITGAHVYIALARAPGRRRRCWRVCTYWRAGRNRSRRCHSRILTAGSNDQVP